VKKNEIIGFIPSDSPIQSCIVPGNDNVKKVASCLQENGFDVRPILHPTVANNEERIRICIHEYNTNDEISQLLKTLKMGLA
jgi:8-amino-7-oxononanoate synthase